MANSGLCIHEGMQKSTTRISALVHMSCIGYNESRLREIANNKKNALSNGSKEQLSPNLSVGQRTCSPLGALARSYTVNGPVF